MATGGFPTQQEEDFRHTCSLCMEPYRGRSPKILPCFHTFCLPCLTALQESVTTATIERPLEEKTEPEENQPDSKTDGAVVEKETAEKQDGTCAAGDVTGGDGDVTYDSTNITGGHEDAGKGVFLCPTCRAPVRIPEGGVAKLQTNFYLNRESGADEDPPPILCDMCDDGNQQHAAHACQQCHLRMCRSCRRHHDMLLPGHHVTSVSLGQPRKEGSEKKGLCLVHQDQALCFHCRQCDVSICLHCKLTSHEGHATVDMASATLQAKEEVTSLVTTAQQQLQVMESSMRRVDRDERELTRHKEEVTQQINARCDVLMTWAKRSRDELMEEVLAKEKSARSQLRAEKTAATVTMETLSSLVSRAARVAGNDPDVVLLRNELRAALLSEDRLDHHRRQADRQEPLLGWRYDVTEASVLQLEVVQAYMGRVVEGGRADVTRPRALRELADKVDRLMNELTETNNNVTANTTNITTSATSIAANTTNIAANTTDIAANATNITANTTNIAANTTSITDTTSELKSWKDKVLTLTAEKEAGLEKKIKSLTKQLSSLKAQIGETGKMFSVRCLDEDETKQYKAQIYRTVEFNKDNCFDENTGVFKAPFDGVYVISARVETDKMEAQVCSHIMIGDNSHTTIRGGYDGKSVCVLVQLKSSQKVWMKAENPVIRYYFKNITFSGTLIQTA